MNFEDVLGFLRVDFEALNLGFQNLVVFLHLVNLCNPQLLHLCLLHLHLLLKPLLLLPHLKLLMSQLIFPNVDNLVHLCTDGQGCRQSGQSAHMCDHPRMVLLLLHVLLLQRHHCLVVVEQHPLIVKQRELLNHNKTVINDLLLNLVGLSLLFSSIPRRCAAFWPWTAPASENIKHQI